MEKYTIYIKWSIILLIVVGIIIFVVTYFYPLLLLALVALLCYMHINNSPDKN
jgi:hypothetical protein